MSANPDIKLVVTDHGNLTGTMQTFLEAAGKKPGDVFAAGFDTSGNAVEAIQGGWLQLVIDQQQWLQGYFGVLQICLTHNYGFAGLQIDTGAGFVRQRQCRCTGRVGEEADSLKRNRSQLADAFLSLTDQQ